MLPNLTIPSVVAPPPRASEPAGSPTDDAAGGDAFAAALQRAQREPKPERSREPRAQTAKPADTHARAARPAQGKSPTREATEQPAGDAACSDAAAATTIDDSAVGDAVPLALQATEQDPSQPAQPLLAIDSAAAPQAIVQATRIEPTRADVEADPADAAGDGRVAPGRLGSRSDNAHDKRAGPSQSGRATPPNEPANGRDNAAAALPLHAAIEHAAAEASAAPASTLRAPAFERPAVEPPASLLAAGSMARETSSIATSPSGETKLPQAALRAAIDEPGFGAALGTQVSVWVREGVQEARLQLHPAELGPVTVQIALEGQAAHVDFTAAVAATRESIEQSLPALAAALRDSGFTLAGGGVSSHGGGNGEARRERAGIGHGNRSRTDAGADAGPVASAPRRWARSLLDVYA